MTIEFKNPYRGRKAAKPKPYVPEHRRLDLDPVEYPLKDPEEFDRMNRKHAAEKKKSEDKKAKDLMAKEVMNKFKQGELTKDELERELYALYNVVQTQEVAQNVPQEATIVPVSGQSEDHLWTHGLKKEDHVKDSGSLVVESAVDAEEIADVPSPPETPYAHDNPELVEDTSDLVEEDVKETIVDDLFSEEESSGFGLDQIKPGEYVLLYSDSVLATGSISSVKEQLSNILLDSDEDNASVDDFVVLKRVPVKMGIFIDD